MDFAAIDFETANFCPSSICSIGAVVVRNGQVTDRIYTLVCPEPEYYTRRCTHVHGLTLQDTCQAPCFADAWAQVAPRIGGLPLFAHNARFDEGCLRAALETYGMEWPGYRFHDTLRASRRAFGRALPDHQLHTVAAACGSDLTRHHHALADAEACAAIALYLEPYFEL